MVDQINPMLVNIIDFQIHENTLFLNNSPDIQKDNDYLLG